MVFKRIRKLQNRGGRYRYGQRLDVVKVFIYYLFVYFGVRQEVKENRRDKKYISVIKSK
jgi:hypothetical protein